MWLLIGVWVVLAWVVVRLIGRGIRLADVHEGLVPQLDDPLRRGTDLEPPLMFHGDEVSVSDDLPPALAGAILALAYATDETSARYWLAVCARRGATPPVLDQLWRTWELEYRPPTDAEDEEFL
jgi:hypothetical protein